MAASDLPVGFTLDQPQPPSKAVALPVGFTLDEPQGSQTTGWKPYTPSGERSADIANVTGAEAIIGNPVTQFAIGAAEPLLGAAQAIGLPIDANAIKDMSERGAQLYGGDWTRVPARIAGNILSPVFLKLAKSLPASATLGDLVKAGAVMGGVAGATSLIPGESGFDTLPERGERTAAGVALGGALPLGIQAATTVGGGVLHVADLFRGDKGAANILDRYVRKTIGSENVPAVAQQLRVGGVEPLPGYKPTVAEAVSKLPEGSPLIAHQKITSATPGGPSALFGRRVTDQKDAVTAAYEARDKATAPIREAAIKAANAGGVRSDDVVSQIDALLQQPGYRASEVINKSLTKVKEKVGEFSTHGYIDANDLYTIRKELGNTIQTFAKETANWDKRLTGGLERNIQKSIDDAIVKAGGTIWPHYLAEYSARSKAIEGVKEAAKAAIRPAQRTDLFGGLRIAEETRTHVPQLLSRPMMAANAIMRYFSANIEPRIDRLAAQRYLNPLEFAKALDKMPPQTQNQIIEAMKRIGIANAVLQLPNDPADPAQQAPTAPAQVPPPLQNVRRGINSALPPGPAAPPGPRNTASFVRG